MTSEEFRSLNKDDIRKQLIFVKILNNGLVKTAERFGLAADMRRAQGSIQPIIRIDKTYATVYLSCTTYEAGKYSEDCYKYDYSDLELLVEDHTYHSKPILFNHKDLPPKKFFGG